VSLNELFALGLPVPPLDEQTEIAEMAEAFQNSANAALQSASNASQLSGAFTATLFSL
jgi:restriction endonuclease S subunit